MDGPNKSSFQSNVENCKICFGCKQFLLKMNPIHVREAWDLIFYSDNDWAGDPEMRVSVPGCIIYLIGAPICWQSKGQKGITCLAVKPSLLQCPRQSKKLD
jgi:hypothetical protein